LTKAGPALFLILLAIGLVFLQSFHLQAMGQAATPLVRIDPPQTFSGNIGDNFTIYVWVDNASGVEAAQVQFTYDLNVLNVTSVDEGPFLQSVGATIVAQHYAAPISDALGEVYYASAGISGNTASGSGILLNVTFTVLAEGASQFHLIPYYYAAGSTNPGTYFLDINSAITVGDLTDGFYGSPISFTASQTLVSIGDTVTLNGQVSGTLARNITSIDVTYKPLLSENWAELASISTNGSGYFSYPWTSTENGAFEFQVSFNYAGKITNGTVVEVIVQQRLQGYGNNLIYAISGFIAFIIAAVIILHVRSARKLAAAKPPI
jgi:hypothetical protein